MRGVWQKQAQGFRSGLSRQLHIESQSVPMLKIRPPPAPLLDRVRPVSLDVLHYLRANRVHLVFRSKCEHATDFQWSIGVESLQLTRTEVIPRSISAPSGPRSKSRTVIRTQSLTSLQSASSDRPHHRACTPQEHHRRSRSRLGS